VTEKGPIEDLMRYLSKDKIAMNGERPAMTKTFLEICRKAQRGKKLL
jgi:hypothetical protein